LIERDVTEMNSVLNMAICDIGIVHLLQTLRQNINAMGLSRKFDERREEHHHQTASEPADRI
jgi:hypothetical protein